MQTHVLPGNEKDAPSLAAGDFLTREEFIRRWEAHPEVKKAELIGGVVYTPAIEAEHGEKSPDVLCWLRCYAAQTPGSSVGTNGTWRMLTDAPQPDAHLRLQSEYGGTSWIERGFLHGAPELAAETAYSSSSYDLHQKKELYESAGVQEYFVHVLAQCEVHWFRLVGSKYQLLPLHPDGTLRSLIFPGLWLDAAALVRGDMIRLLEVLNLGLRAPEHAEFARILAERRQSRPEETP